MTLDDTPMFDPTLLKDLDWNQNTVKFTPDVSPSSPGEGLVLRPLCTVDFNRGLFDLLSQLTKVGEVTTEQFLRDEFLDKCLFARFVDALNKEHHFGKWDTSSSHPQKLNALIPNYGETLVQVRGRIEEVIVRDECRGKQLGKLLIAVLTLLSKKLNCYKTTLECLPKNTAFYEKFGFKVGEDVYMQNRFFD